MSKLLKCLGPIESLKLALNHLFTFEKLILKHKVQKSWTVMYHDQGFSISLLPWAPLSGCQSIGSILSWA